MKILFILLVISFKLNSQDFFQNDETDEISSIIDSVKEELMFEKKDTSSLDYKNEDSNKQNKDKYEELDKPTVSEKPIKKNKPIREDAFLSSNFVDYTGEAGSWLLNIVYENHDYGAGPRKNGLSIEYAWVLDFNFLTFHAISNLSYYKGYYSNKGFFPLGLGAEVLLGLPRYMFISTHYVFEYAKQEAGDFLSFTRYGLGMYFNLSNINKNSQFQMYRNHGIRRTYFILKYNIRNTNATIDFYSKKSIMAGFGFEY